jgi:peptide chain release factor subunit 1
MATDITTDRLRELAGTRSAEGKVLSLYINLDPRHFAAPPARATELSSVLDAASRTIRDNATLTHEERVALNDDLERVRERLQDGILRDVEGARGLAVFASKPAGLFEVLKLPRPVDHAVWVADAPVVEPLARIGAGELWWLLLVDRRRVRLLTGTVDGLVEVWRQDDETSGRHDQGGWSQARYQRSIDKEAEDHLRAVDAELQRRLRDTRIAGLLLAGPQETIAQLQSLMHPDVAKCVAGRFDADVWNTSADQVLDAARPVLDELTARRDQELLQRIEEGLGMGGRAAAGLEDVLRSVVERRIDTLVVQETFTAKGTRCPQCGWLGVSAGAQCPADGTMTQPVDNIVDAAVACTYGQDARVRYLPMTAEALETKGSIAALLRF